MQKVLIIDSAPARAKKMQKAFHSLADCYRYEFDPIERRYEFLDFDSSPASPHFPSGKIDLVLIHGRDQDKRSLVADCKHHFWYGGYGLFDRDARRKEPLLRRRIYSNGRNALLLEEARELLEFVAGQRQEAPNCLFSPNELFEAVLDACDSLYGAPSEEKLAQLSRSFSASELAQDWSTFERALPKQSPDNSTRSLSNPAYSKAVDQFRINALDTLGCRA
ncbi:MAG: hypothetical protein AAFW73_23655 [Bacteroidota bacterium]